jgi:cytochrome c oxidase subunit 4
MTDEQTDTEATGGAGASTALMTAEERSRELAHHPEQLPLLPGELKPHPSPRQYVLIAVVLVIVTALEVGASYLEGDVSSNLLIMLLAVMAAVKFFLVVSWYMHLRTDLKVFRRTFVVGLLLAGAVYMVALSTLHIFDDSAGG